MGKFNRKIYFSNSTRGSEQIMPASLLHTPPRMKLSETIVLPEWNFQRCLKFRQQRLILPNTAFYKMPRISWDPFHICGCSNLLQQNCLDLKIFLPLWIHKPALGKRIYKMGWMNQANRGMKMRWKYSWAWVPKAEWLHALRKYYPLQ